MIKEYIVTPRIVAKCALVARRLRADKLQRLFRPYFLYIIKLDEEDERRKECERVEMDRVQHSI